MNRWCTFILWWSSNRLILICLSCSNYTALVGVWIYGFFVMVLLALDFLYYSAINYELCRVYLEKWGLGGRWLKKARSQWNRSMPEESETQAQAQPMVPGHYQPRHSIRGESQSPTPLPYNTSTAWWVTVCQHFLCRCPLTIKKMKGKKTCKTLLSSCSCCIQELQRFEGS